MTGAARALLVGTGKVAGDRHLPALAVLEGRLRLVGVCDQDPERAAAVARETGTTPYADLDAALEAARPDLVLVATPAGTHADLVPRCLRAGAWVACEKPAARSLAELDVIAAAEAETGNHCSFIYQQRFGSTAQLVRRLAESGDLGPARLALAETLWFRDDDYWHVPWRGGWEREGGGALFSLGVHALDLALWLTGERWTEVNAMAARLDRDIEVDNLSGAIVRLESGGLLHVVTSTLSPDQESRVRLDYADATVEVRHLYTHTNDDWRLHTATEVLRAAWSDRASDPVSDHAELFAAMLDARERGEAPPCSGEDGRAAFEVVTACYASALTGRTVGRGDVAPGDPFYGRLDGGLSPWPRTRYDG